MTKFFSIQRGRFLEEGKTLIGKNGIVKLDYMGAAEFELGAIPNSYNRILSNFQEYDIFCTGIYTPEQEELLVFCREKHKTETIQEICRFIEQPYQLKAYSELEKIPKAKKGDTTYDGRNSDFWWCIDEPYGDWIAILQSKSETFMQIIRNDYHSRYIENNKPKKRKGLLSKIFCR